ncbi:MAG: Rrf2 family transcriptional regulator [Coriobacteriia bacterium]|nr:Rrf2 family transcriptional regulator [Coriobacteriia bacterium]MCL2746700.1 Rrf2 family transcriptional regulator [Coriobacteriia bacterium]MCL2871240.1 Rrf2 family transcriptional regulator [Coriobacteriia bacterium]
MLITRRTDYAIRIMRTIAENDSGKPISVREIAERDTIPYQFARRITYDLSNEGLVKVTRGVRGGADLARSADKISMLDIITVGQGRPICSRCSVEDGWCENEDSCSVKTALEDLDVIVNDYLDKLMLNQVIRPVESRPYDVED